jgi:hemerythrin-like domain-containing protein
MKDSFPSEHGKNNQIIYKYIEEGEAIDDNAENPNFKIIKRVKNFYGNGTSFEKLPTAK